MVPFTLLPGQPHSPVTGPPKLAVPQTIASDFPGLAPGLALAQARVIDNSLESSRFLTNPLPPHPTNQFPFLVNFIATPLSRSFAPALVPGATSHASQDNRLLKIPRPQALFFSILSPKPQIHSTDSCTRPWARPLDAALCRGFQAWWGGWPPL